MMTSGRGVDGEEHLQNTKRTRVVHCWKEEYGIYIGRPSKWGNRFTHRPGTKLILVSSRLEAIRCYRAWLMTQPVLMRQVKEELQGEVLRCWCKPKACHGDVLAEIADR